MKCSQILNQALTHDPEIYHLTQDSREVWSGSLFFCNKRGEQAQQYIQDARQRGAAAIVCTEQREDTIFSENPRRDYALACQRFWQNPQEGLQLIAITGTNGKSSTAWLLQHILESCGKKCGLIGTICSKFGQQQIPAVYTTPDAAQLYPLLAQMKQAGCTHVVLEASSQAIAQERLAGLRFVCGIFTNLSRDHLDQHGTMEEYFNVKQSIFTQCDLGLSNLDDDYGLKLSRNLSVTRYSLYSSDANYRAYQQKKDRFSSEFWLFGGREMAAVHLPFPGEFFVSNAVAALAAANLLGVPLEAGAKALKCCPAVPGRAQCLFCGSFDVLIDYAHTSDGLEKIFRLAQSCMPRKLYAVFGCAGERDRGDRAAMAETVLRYADRAVFTADNPRGESWQQICQDIPQQEKLLPIFDREEAIRTAASWCCSGDLLLLLGKGHEDYQVLADRTVYFSEEELLRQILKND
ncbi:MAG: UDP-N-acetylmuramoyl-L-alanyl-D-glutamate--2,6-diaminopimelate ligase [Oscillospiraceae bacterium]|nr:UDP-N-acetylmuramoyl-L-alanyl-D-glutamate--2,6-diaminopimelate ligase [Oscillospiraceae bacterium]